MKIRNARRGLFDQSRINGGRILIRKWRTALRKGDRIFGFRILRGQNIFFFNTRGRIASAVFNGFLPGVVVVIPSPLYLCHELVRGTILLRRGER